MFSFTKKGIKFRKYTPSELDVRPVSTERVYLPVGEVYLQPGDRVQVGGVISTLDGVSVFAPCDGLFAGVESVELPDGAKDHAVILANSTQNSPFAYTTLNIPTLEMLVDGAKMLRAPDLARRLGGLPGRQVVIRALDEGPDQASAAGMVCACLKEIISCAGWLEAISRQRAAIYTNNSSIKMFVGDHSADIAVHSVSRKYPSSHWLEKKIAKLDAVVFDVSELRNLFHCVAYGQPPLNLLVAVSYAGEQVEICRVPVGTPVSALFDETLPDGRFVLNGVLQGRTVAQNYPLTLQDRSVTFVPLRHEQPAACIGCGRCVGVCPVGIAPVFINEQRKYMDKKTARQYGADRCIACGACNYICPSKLPLQERIRAVAEVSDHA